MVVNVNLGHGGAYAGAWRLPDARPDAFFNIAYYQDSARLAEEGGIDAVFLADAPALLESPEYRAPRGLDPLVVLSAVAMVTRNIGLIGTASTSYNPPYTIARAFASLDHISKGRAAWNIVASADDAVALNFGDDSVADHGARYARADEAVRVVKALWDSWAPDAIAAEKTTGLLFDQDAIRPIDHEGRFFKVKGPLNLPRSPQGRPVLVQAGSSPEGRDFAARHADVLFTVQPTLSAAIAFRADMRARAADHGREPDHLLVLPGIVLIPGASAEQARERQAMLEQLVPADYKLAKIAAALQLPLAALDPARPLPEHLLPPLDRVSSQGAFSALVGRARAEGWTVGELVRHHSGGPAHFPILCGDAEQIADGLEQWFQEGAADGFNLILDAVPSTLRVVAHEIMPILRARGLVRTGYGSAHLRERYGLPTPIHQPQFQGGA